MIIPLKCTYFFKRIVIITVIANLIKLCFPPLSHIMCNSCTCRPYLIHMFHNSKEICEFWFKFWPRNKDFTFEMIEIIFKTKEYATKPVLGSLKGWTGMSKISKNIALDRQDWGPWWNQSRRKQPTLAEVSTVLLWVPPRSWSHTSKSKEKPCSRDLWSNCIQDSRNGWRSSLLLYSESSMISS